MTNIVTRFKHFFYSYLQKKTGRMYKDITKFSWDGTSAKQFKEGYGNASNPYLIHDAEELALIARLVNLGLNGYNELHYKLIADIDLTGINWIPIGISPLKAFSGIFDGNNHTINGLSINNSSEISYFHGLFGYIQGNNSLIKDLTLTNVRISGKSYIGSLAGFCGTSNINNCHSSGNIQAAGHYVGGLVGKSNEVNYVDCSTNCCVNAHSYIGGITGYAENCELEHTFSISTISSLTHYSGGLMGYGRNTSIKYCFASGNCFGNDSVGGLSGYFSNGKIEDSYSTCLIGGNGLSVGSLIGYNFHGNLMNSYGSGQIAGEDLVGALIGYNYYGEVDNCYFEKFTDYDSEAVGKDCNNRLCWVTGLSLTEMCNNDWLPNNDNNSEWINVTDETNPTLPQLKHFYYSEKEFIKQASINSVTINTN